MAFEKLQATMNNLYTRASRGQKSQMCDAQDPKAELERNGRDRDAKPSLYARFQRKLGDINTSLKKRKNERKCLRKTHGHEDEPGQHQHTDAEPSITQSRTIEYRDIDLGKRARAELDRHNEEGGEEVYQSALHYPNTLTAKRHSQEEDIFTGTAIESTDAYRRLMRTIGGDEATYPPPPTRPPPPVPTQTTCVEHEVTMPDRPERDWRPQTRSTQRTSSDESLWLSKTRSAQSGAGGHSRKPSDDTTATSLCSIEECTEYTDISGIGKAVAGESKASHQPASDSAGAADQQQQDADKGQSQDSLEGTINNVKAGDEKAVAARRARPWQTVTEWHNPDLPPLETPPDTSDDESVDEPSRPRKSGRGLPPRMQEEIKKNLALVDALMAYKLGDDPDAVAAAECRLGTAVAPEQYVSAASPKRVADISALKGTLDPRKDMDFASFINHDDWDGNTDGDVPTPPSPIGQVGSSVAQGFEGDDKDDFFGSDFASCPPVEPADLLLYYKESSDEGAEWGLEEEASYQTYVPDPYSNGNWTTQLDQIDEEPIEDSFNDEPSAELGLVDGDWPVDELRGMIKIEGSLDAIKSHVDRYVNEEGDLSASTSTTSIACSLSDEDP